MDFLTDLILRYGLIFGKRFWAKQKLAFLRMFSKEVSQFGYYLDAKLARLSLTKRQHRNFYNAYIGDLDSAKIIVCTYYDTGINSFNLTAKYAFNSSFNAQHYWIRLLPVIGLFLTAVLLNVLFFIPAMQQAGMLSFLGAMSVITTCILFYFIVRYHGGIPNRNNFVCNSSSLILLLNLMKKCDKKQRKNIAFVLLDGGCSNPFGLRMFENYSKSVLKKKVIFIDSIGNGDDIQLFKPHHYSLELDNVSFCEGQIETQFTHYCLITSGQRDKLNQVRIHHANSAKDNTLPSERIERHTDTILNLCLQIISCDK